MVCNKPKCFRPRAGKCMKPNAWIVYIMEMSGKGYSRKQIELGYKQWKYDKFGKYTDSSKTSTRKRNEAMCSGTYLGLGRTNSSKSSSRSRSRSSVRPSPGGGYVRSPSRSTALERARRKALALAWGDVGERTQRRLERERRVKSNERRKATKIQALRRGYVLRRKLNAEREARRARRSNDRSKDIKSAKDAAKNVGLAKQAAKRPRRVRFASDIKSAKAAAKSTGLALLAKQAAKRSRVQTRAGARDIKKAKAAAKKATKR